MRATRDNLGFLLAKALQRWNELLAAGFRRRGFAEVRPAYGSVLLPLFEEDGLRLSELAARSRLSKQAMTTLVRTLEARRLIVRRPDPDDGRAARVYLTPRARRFQATAEHVLATLDRRVERRLSRDRLDALRDAVKTLMTLGDQPPAAKEMGYESRHAGHYNRRKSVQGLSLRVEPGEPPALGTGLLQGHPT